MQKPERKPIIFMGSSLKELRKFPKDVRRDIGYDLDAVQCGETPMAAKRFKGFPGLMELVERYDTDTYRSVYTLSIKEKVYVLHCFKKKSKRGAKTPKEDMDIIKQRLKEAKELSKGG